jgi:hypothetical protein
MVRGPVKPPPAADSLIPKTQEADGLVEHDREYCCIVLYVIGQCSAHVSYFFQQTLMELW